MSRPCAVSGSVTMPWNPTVPVALQRHAFTLPILISALTACPVPLDVCAQMHGVRASEPHIPSHHNLYRIAEMVVMVTCTTVSIVVGMIGTEAIRAWKWQQRECNGASPQSAFCRHASNLFPVIVFALFSSISSTRRVYRSSRVHTYISSHLDSLSDGLAGYTFPFYNTLAVQKTTGWFNRARVCTGPAQPYYASLPYTELAGPGYELCARC
jgi:hypothetical protein